jgi:hypothetical protein
VNWPGVNLVGREALGAQLSPIVKPAIVLD